MTNEDLKKKGNFAQNFLVSVMISVDRNSNLVSVTKRKLTFSFIKPL